jgi:hypothetical protein
LGRIWGNQFPQTPAQGCLRCAGAFAERGEAGGKNKKGPDAPALLKGRPAFYKNPCLYGRGIFALPPQGYILDGNAQSGVFQMGKLKNKRFLLLGMSGALLVFGLMFTACDDDSGGGGFGGHTLTVTGIPAEHNGKYIMALGNLSGSTAIVGVASIDGSSYTLVKIAGGSAVIPIYYMDTAAGSYKPYTDDGSGSVTLSVYESSSGSGPPSTYKSVSVDFSNGSVSKTW